MLTETFTDGAFVTYAKLVRVKWTGQPIDVYANDIRQLTGLAGFKGEGLESIVRLTFVSGFPDKINIALQQVNEILTKPVSDLINTVRILCKSKADEELVAVARGVELPKKDSGSKGLKGKCFKCGGPHLIRYFDEKVSCFKCNKVGHIARHCDQQTQEYTQGQGNEKRGTAAPAVTPLVMSRCMYYLLYVCR